MKSVLSLLRNLLTALPALIPHPPLPIADGPVLVHTTGGELLRCLEAGEGAPGSLALSREGLVVAIYGGGHVASFTMNGCRLRHQQHTDNIQVGDTT